MGMGMGIAGGIDIRLGTGIRIMVHVNLEIMEDIVTTTMIEEGRGRDETRRAAGIGIEETRLTGQGIEEGRDRGKESATAIMTGPISPQGTEATRMATRV